MLTHSLPGVREGCIGNEWFKIKNGEMAEKLLTFETRQRKISGISSM